MRLPFKCRPKRLLLPMTAWAALVCGAALAVNPRLAASVPTIGLPVVRTYSIEEIGVSRGPHLDFDHFGRLAVASGLNYVVLNDGVWLDIADEATTRTALIEIVCNSEGQYFFASLANWGRARYTERGTISPVPLRPDDYPSWVNSTTFAEVAATDEEVLFVGANGIVRLDLATDEQSFYQLPVSTAFVLNGELIASSNSLGTFAIDRASGAIRTIDPTVAIHEVARFGENRIVGATNDEGLVLFDGKSFSKFDLRLKNQRIIRVSDLEALPDGGFAVAIDGEGLFLFSADGEPQLALSTNDYRRIYDLASQEPGILWLATESSVQKLLYNNPVSIVDQRSDVVIGWPQVVTWNNRSIIASNGRLYEMELASNGLRYQFREFENLPSSGAWAIAASGDRLLIGNGDGVFVPSADGFDQLPGLPGATRLFFPEPDVCVVIGSDEIAAIRWNGSRWTEAAERIPGIAFPSVMHQSGNDVWIELGLNLAARVRYKDGQLSVQRFESFPWEQPTWINIGILDDYIVFSGPDNERVYRAKDSLEIVAPPALENVLDQSPYIILRVFEDSTGLVWATHPTGVLTFSPDGDEYRMDAESLLSIRDHYPLITLLDRKHAWISTESALYHVDQNFLAPSAALHQPFLISISDGKTGQQLYTASPANEPLERLPYSRNHLEFRYFSGGYRLLLHPSYEFSMENATDSWRVRSPDSLLTLPSLEEGNYTLTAQLWDAGRAVGEPIVTRFSIAAPWFRSGLAYAAYWSSGILACLLIASRAANRAKRKHDFLEKLVNERTEELRATMQKLTKEARTSATLAERNRLAGEIHDSLQQGLSGLALQLDSTLKHNYLEPDIRSRLTVARRMVSFTRQEVQQAVWDLESPLLENDDLVEALRSMADLLGATPMLVKVESEGAPIDMPSRTKHHLLRIAQEAITNAIRHSSAKSIRVRLVYAADEISLEVSDDGKGFDTSDVIGSGLGHFGLRGLRARAAKIHGELRIESEPGKGTRILLSLPVETNESAPTGDEDELKENTNTPS